MCSAVPPSLLLDIRPTKQRDRTERQAERGRHAGRNAAREPRDIEAIVAWVYGEQQAHRSAVGLGRERGWLGYGSGDYSRPVVQGGGAGSFDLAPDAELVHDVIGRRPDLRILVEFGRGAMRPDWKPGARPRCQPVLDGGGYPTVVREYDRNRNPRLEWCPIEYLDDVEVIAAARRRYLDWWHALVSLRRLVGPRLARWQATGPAAPRRPWLARTPLDRTMSP